VDFYVSRKWPAEGRRKHAGPTRAFWPSWFAYDNVFPSPDHLPYLSYRFTPVAVEERAGRNPYLLGIKVPYYLFVGRKPA
jgi:S-adenosylmethionine-diacylgycerolhomoserine-N-methlytransferase